MKVIIEGNTGTDFPNLDLKDYAFMKALEKSVRNRLDLRKSDEVIILINKTYDEHQKLESCKGCAQGDNWATCEPCYTRKFL